MAANDAVVLDTNVVLDWLVFDDPRAAALAAAIENRSLRWISCLAMRQEFERTLGYRTLTKWRPSRERSLSRFDQYAVMEPAPPSLPALRCSDPDDQIFIDLAIASGAGWLLTHDRALLRLAKRTGPLGLRIVQPARWPA